METTPNVIQKTLSLKKAYQGPKCSAMNCDNSSRKRDELNMNISFHRFPRDPVLQEEWVKRVRPTNYTNILNRHVCSAHFEPRFFCKKHKPGSMTKLVEGTLPTLNLPPGVDVDKDNTDSDPLELQTEADMPQMVQGQMSSEKNYEQDIEMVELSSDDSEEEVDVIVTDDGSPELSTAAALAATSALHVPKTRTSGPQLKPGGPKGRRKSSIADKSPTKTVMSVMENSMDGSLDSSRFSGDDLEDEEIIFIPCEELDYIDLQDPLEVAYNTWKSMNEKSRRATIKAYLCRLASFFPSRFPRNNMPNIMVSATRYLDEVTRENAILAIEQEILTQRHYILRKKRAKLDQLIKKKGKESSQS